MASPSLHADADGENDAPSARRAHEMRNAVYALQAAAQVLHRVGSDSELGADALAIIERQAQRLVGLLDGWEQDMEAFEAANGRQAVDGVEAPLPDGHAGLQPEGGLEAADGARPPPHADAPLRLAVLLERRPQHLETLRGLVEGAGYQALCVIEADEALRLMLAQRPEAMVAAVNGDDPAAFRFSRRCRAAGYSGQMIALVDPSHAERALPLLQAGYDAVLPLPADPQRLRRLMRGDD